MFLHILDEQRIHVLNQIIQVQPKSFYLAGETSLALQLGHRDSIDFDWFSDEVFGLDELSDSFIELGSYRESYNRINKKTHFIVFESGATYISLLFGETLRTTCEINWRAKVFTCRNIRYRVDQMNRDFATRRKKRFY